MNPSQPDSMREATRLTRAGRLAEATRVLLRMLGTTVRTGKVPRATQTTEPCTTSAATAVTSALVLDDCMTEVRTPAGAGRAEDMANAPPRAFEIDPGTVQPRHVGFALLREADAAAEAEAGEFTSGTHTHASRTLRYKLFVPSGHRGRPLPLVVMLHGCTQNPDDFAAGTGMNEQAREQGFIVLYPEQVPQANPSGCWNWFKHNHQQRGHGEPALLASLTQSVIQRCCIDARRVYIAGLSAGGAMAAIVAAAYPELFAAVGVHSGLPGGAASNVAEALAVMKGGGGGVRLRLEALPFGEGPEVTLNARRRVPTIVFHGDQDQTVHPRNGEQVIAAALGHPAGAPLGSAPASSRVEHGVSAHGRRYTRHIHHDDDGSAFAEHWLVHGAGHAWSGGQAKGSYTDARGPDATREMLRFFFAQSHPLAR